MHIYHTRTKPFYWLCPGVACTNTYTQTRVHTHTDKRTYICMYIFTRVISLDTLYALFKNAFPVSNKEEYVVLAHNNYSDSLVVH